MSLSKKLLLIISFIFCLVNIYVIYHYSLFENRLIRLLSLIFYFGVFAFFKGYKNRTVFAVFICFLVSDVFMLHYERPWQNGLYLSVKIVAYLALTYHVFKKLFFVKVNRILVVISILLISLLLYVILLLVGSIEPHLMGTLEQILLYVISVSMLAICVVANYYLFLFGTKHSLFFINFTFAIVLSDACAFVAYYFDFEQFYYADRFFYLYGLFFMVRYGLKGFEKEEIPVLRNW